MNTNASSPNSASQQTRPVSVLITNHQTAVLDEIAAAFRRDTGNYMSRSDMIREILSAVLPYFADWGLGASAREGGDSRHASTVILRTFTTMNGSNRIRLLRILSTDHAAQAKTLSTKVVGSIRVSTEEQAANGHGLEVQHRAIRSFAESQSYTLVDVVSDAGVSGAKRPEDRSGFQQIIELAKERKFSMLLLWKFNRLARNLLFSVTTVHQLKEQYGIGLRSVTEPIDTASPMGEMIFAILASFAAEERRVITGRTLGGKKGKASRGGFAGGAAPLGYKRDLQGDHWLVTPNLRLCGAL